jgi:hypothetical protein
VLAARLGKPRAVHELIAAEFADDPHGTLGIYADPHGPPP